MSEFKFVPGEYKTRDGRRAIVRFRVQEPCSTSYPLVGEVQGEDGHWDRWTWTEDGVFSRLGKCNKSDLVPPVRYCYKNCFEHDTGGKFEDDPTDNPGKLKRYGVLRFELTPQGRPDWRTVEFIPVENLEHA